MEMVTNVSLQRHILDFPSANLSETAFFETINLTSQETIRLLVSGLFFFSSVTSFSFVMYSAWQFI